MLSKINGAFRSQRGQSLVEFALVLPVFILILFGIMEFGRLWETANIMTSAAREAARIAAVTTPNIQQASEAAQRILDAGNIDDAVVTVNGPDSNNEITVTISLEYMSFTGSIIPELDPFIMTRSTTMRWEG